MQRRLFRMSVVAACATAGAVVLAQATQDTPHNAPVQSGAQIFVDSGCAQCHGPAGLGTSKGPSLRNLRKGMTADQVHSQIKEGGKSMPPFGDALTDPQISALVAFLRSKKAWQAPLPPPTPPAPTPASSGDNNSVPPK